MNNENGDKRAVKDKLKLLLDVLLDIFIWFLFFVGGCVCICTAIALPELGITSLIAAIGMIVITNKDKIFKGKKED